MIDRIACATCSRATTSCSSYGHYKETCFDGKLDVFDRYPQYAVIGVPKNIKRYKYSEWEPEGAKASEILPEEIFEI